MTFWRALFAFVEALLRSLFHESEAKKVGRLEERIANLQKTVEIRSAMQKAEKPETGSDIDSLLRSGKLTLLLCLFIAACSAPQAITTCPTLKAWTQNEQTHLANELLLLPKDSMILSVMKDYVYLRNQIRVCNTTEGQGL